MLTYKNYRGINRGKSMVIAFHRKIPIEDPVKYIDIQEELTYIFGQRVIFRKVRDS
jgi:hypothetical protein